MVIKLAGAGVITLETAVGIMAGGGAAVGGGTELANQVQSGGAINPGAVATRTAFGGVKGALWGLAPELGAVGFGASIGAYSAVENLTYNAAKGKTTASDSIEAIAGGLGEGLFAGIMHKASSKASGKASESTPAKPEPIKPMTEAELEKVSGGAKNPGWKPNSVYTDAINKAPYNSRKMEQLLKANGEEISSKTLPNINSKNVKLAGTKHPVTGIVFNERGFPIFDDVAKVDLKLDAAVTVIKNRNLHFKNATAKLHKLIDCGIVKKNIFSEEQLKYIFSDAERIPGYTWHHHEEVGRMQLVPSEFHMKTGHIGGFDLWFK